jgi:rhodanese-related sulfurtransferase
VRGAVHVVLSLVLGLAALLAEGSRAPARADTAQLRAIENDVSRRWPNIRHMPTEQLTRMLEEGSVRLFDVRDDAEYRVSRIEGAERVHPRIRPEEFLERHAHSLAGRAVVFYCSAGVRSSRLADSVARDLKTRGAIGVYNLKGGIFAWHNEGRRLVDATGPTNFVHPYSRSWGRALTRQHLLRTKQRE